MKMIFACDYCKFVFSQEAESEQCPDCGKFAVRPANEKEQMEYHQILAENENDLMA